jgi:hypothetical protein
MANIFRFILVASCLLFVTQANAQHKRYAIQNGIGIFGGLTQLDIITDNFETKSSSGWIGGLSANVDIPHKWYNVSYVIQLSENNVNIIGSPQGSSTTEEIEYKMTAAQIGLLMHIKLANRYLSIDVGPMLQYSGELELKDDSQENYVLAGYTNLTANDISNINKFNANGVVGLTAGFDNFRLRAHYIYGFTNMLNNLNKDGLDVTGNSSGKFKGNQSMLVFGAFFLF